MRSRPARCTTVDPQAWTGLTIRQLRRLIGQLREACPDTGRGRALGFPDRVLPLALAHRTNLTRQQPAAPFGVSDSAVHRAATARHASPRRPARAAPAALPGPPRADRREPWVVDGTLIPVHDKDRTAKSKNHRRSVHTQIVCRARDRRLVAVGEARPGNRTDTVVFKETLGKTLSHHARLIGDGGHRGNRRLDSARRGPDGRIARDRHHRRFRKSRARAEHTIADSRTKAAKLAVSWPVCRWRGRSL
jgi:hypothetical protein